MIDLLQNSPLFYLTQSLWRDEAYSILSAKHSLSFLINNVTMEPPLYYILLHYWIKIFGTSEIAVRLLSFLPFCLATIVVIFWSEKIFKKHWLSWYLPLFFFINPMLIYYAFEIRTYGWYMFFALLSMYAYLEKRWIIYIFASTLGFYTHTYLILIPCTQFLHWFLNNMKGNSIRKTVHDKFIQSFLIVMSLYIPWFYRLSNEITNLKNSWYFPVDFHLIKSVLGNIFIGYEGTPGGLWIFTFYISIIILGLLILAYQKKENRKYTSYFILQIIFPLALIIGISFIKPLFVNRYLLSVTIAEIFCLTFAIAAIKNTTLQKITGLLLLFGILIFNTWYPTKHAKVNIRNTFTEIKTLLQPSDIILAESPLIFFESIYYANSTRVYLYNPQKSAFPWYVGSAIVSDSQMKSSFPIYPNRAFLVHENGTYDLVYQTQESAKVSTSHK